MKPILPPVLNPELSYILMDMIDEALSPTDGRSIQNDAAVCRLLGINPRTLKLYRIKPPVDPWFNAKLEAALKYVLPLVPRERQRSINKRLHEKMPKDKILPILREGDAHDYLLRKLRKGKVRRFDVLSTASRGPLSVDAIKRAAKKMGVLKLRGGKGKKHESYWKLPTKDMDYEIDVSRRPTPEEIAGPQRKPRKR